MHYKYFNPKHTYCILHLLHVKKFYVLTADMLIYYFLNIFSDGFVVDIAVDAAAAAAAVVVELL